MGPEVELAEGQYVTMSREGSEITDPSRCRSCGRQFGHRHPHEQDEDTCH